MIRAQCIVHRGRQILLVEHHMNGDEWWCLPGGGVEPGESLSEAALRELREECHVSGKIISQTGHTIDAAGNESFTYLVEINDQVPNLGADPEFAGVEPILVDMRWLTLAEIPERDRAYLWAAGLLSIPEFLDKVSHWSDNLSYPDE